MEDKEKENENENEYIFVPKKNTKPIRRSSVTIQQMNFIFKNRLNNKENEVIDNGIKEREKNRRRYSQTLVIPYIPLTRKQKVKEIVNMDKTSANRFNEYSNIFENIKNQINDINNSLLNSNILNNSHSNSNVEKDSSRIINTTSRKKSKQDSMFKHFNSNIEKDISSNSSKIKTKKVKNHHHHSHNFNNHLNNYNINNNIIVGLNDNEKNENEEIEEEDNIDCKTLDENIRHIYLNYSPAPNSLRGTKTKNRQFIKRYINTDNYPKNKGKFIITNNKPSPRDFYYEPTLDENDKNTYQEIKEIKYCKCIIF